MLGRQAKVLAPVALRRALAQIRHHPYPERDRVILLLSVRAGLRACEIAGLTWSMVLDARGRVGVELAVHGRIAKGASGRRIPMHPELRAALRVLYGMSPGTCPDAPVIFSAKGGAMRPNSIVNWFVQLYAALNLEGCSSHSGRRTFITEAARKLHKAGASLRDVQLLAGHQSIETTQRYIDGDSHAQRKLVSLL